MPYLKFNIKDKDVIFTSMTDINEDDANLVKSLAKEYGDKGGRIFLTLKEEINNPIVLDLLSGTEYDNIFVSESSWQHLKTENFKAVSKDLLTRDFIYVVAGPEENGTQNIERAIALLDVLKPEGMDRVRPAKENGKEVIVADLDGQQCMVNVSFGRSSDANEERVIRDKMLNTNIRLTVEVQGAPEEPEPSITHQNITYDLLYTTSDAYVYVPSSASLWTSTIRTIKDAMAALNKSIAQNEVFDTLFSGARMMFDIAEIPDDKVDELYNQPYARTYDGILHIGEDKVYGCDAYKMGQTTTIFPPCIKVKR